MDFLTFKFWPPQAEWRIRNNIWLVHDGREPNWNWYEPREPEPRELDLWTEPREPEPGFGVEKIEI